MKLAICTVLFVLFLIPKLYAQESYTPLDTTNVKGPAFAAAIDRRFNGTSPISPRVIKVPFASLGTEVDGQVKYCTNCTATNPCAITGTGSVARGEGGAWNCGGGTASTVPGNTLASHHFANSINSSGVLSGPQPAFTDLSGVAVSGQIPNPAGDVTGPFSGTTVGGLHFNSTGIPLGTAPFTGQCLAYNGSNITGATCGATAGTINGIINVTDPAYGATGNGVTDDTAALQLAINTACADGTTKPIIYLPATPGSNCYLTSKPLLMNCPNLTVQGAGKQATSICPNFYGPAIMMEGQETGYKTPLTSNVSVTWQSSHGYAQYADILDSNGNIEVQEAASCTSGSGSHPTWPTTQPNTVADNSCTWGLATTGGAHQIATGTGTSLDAADPEFFNGAGYGGNQAQTELFSNAGFLEATQFNAGAAGIGAFTLEFYVEPFASDGGGFANYNLVDISQVEPKYGSNSVLLMGTNGTQTGCTYNCIHANILIGGSVITLTGTGSAASLTINVIHHVAVSYDGSNVRLFVDGSQVASSAATGLFVVPPYQSFVIASTLAQAWPNGHANTASLPAFYDSLRASNNARYTSGFAKPTAKFAADGNTMLLMNFPTTAPTATIQAIYGNNSKVIYYPKVSSNGANTANMNVLSDLSINGMNSIWVEWAFNSNIVNVSGNASDCVMLADNDYQMKLSNLDCFGPINGSQTSVAFYAGNQAGSNVYDHLHCDGQYTCLWQDSGSSLVIAPDYTERGQVIFPYGFFESTATILYPITDIEDTSTRFQADIYNYDAWSPIKMIGGFILSGNSAGAYIQQGGGGQPVVSDGTSFAGTVAEMVNVTATPPAQPVVLRDAVLPSSTPRTNSSQGQYLSIQQNGKLEQSTVNNLWTCGAVNRATSVDITNCTSCTFGAACTDAGGGGVDCLETCNGSTWAAR